MKKILILILANLKPKTIFKIALDFVMTVLLLLVIAARLTGDSIHEILGVILIILFIVHNILNWGWYKALMKGKNNALRILHAALNMLLVAAMLGLTISGVMISHTVFVFMGIDGGLFARQLHTLSAYWGFTFMSMHIGMHWGMLMGAARKMMKITSPNRNRTFALRIIAALISAYGVYAFISREVGLKMILYYMFDFWDYDQSAVFYFIDYLCIMGLFAGIAYYGMKLIQRGSSKKNLVETR